MEMNSLVWQVREKMTRRIVNSQELVSLYFDFFSFGGEMVGNGLVRIERKDTEN